MAKRLSVLLILVLLAALPGSAQQRRKIIIDEDCSGPGGSNMQTPAMLIQSPQVDVLGITVVTGDQWRDEEMAHMLRLLEVMGRTDIPVIPGAEYPLVHRRDIANLWQQRYGKVGYAGAWDPRWWHPANVIPKLPEGMPTTKPAAEDAAHFMVRMVRKYPHQVTIYAGGPMTDLALAIRIDPDFPKLAQELILMGGSLNPHSTDAEWVNSPRHEFNFWFDPEAADIVLRAPWPKIVCTPVDISIKTRFTPAMVKEVKAAGTPLALYVAKYYMPGEGADYMWDELAAAAWLDPSLITKEEVRYMDVDISHGAAYGNTLTWTDNDKPQIELQRVHIQVDLNAPEFYKMFIHLMTAPTPPAH